MNSYSIIQFVTLVIYLVLVLVLMRHAQPRLKNQFVIYLLASMSWSLTSFLAHADLSPAYSTFWARLIPLAASWTIVAYTHFIVTYLKKNSRSIIRIGYGYLSVLAILIALGYIPSSIYNAGSGIIAIDYGYWMYFMTVGGALFLGMAVFFMIKSYIVSKSPEYRNRISYLFFGVAIIVVFGAWFETLSPPRYPVDHIGHFGNALVLTYAIVRYQLFDIRFVIRKGLVYSGITVLITAGYLIVLSILQHWLLDWSSFASAGAIVIIAILMAWMFNPFRTVLQKLVDKLFYGERYDYRQMVQNFAHTMSNVLELKELAEAMLQPITKAVRSSQASLLLPDENGFNSDFAERLEEKDPVTPIKLPKDSPIIVWLSRENKPLTRELIDITPEFKGLWETERAAIEAAEIEVLCPIKTKNKLVAVLAVSKKQPRGFYSSDDIDLLMTAAHEAAVAIENAQLYAKAKQRANTDELTGLYNHRYFHQRLDEEVARCSRFGHIFSLLFLDLDLFKTYNDVYGHLAGDEVLKEVAKCIKSASRSIDVGVRYGGDEFAAILPQTSIDGARKVAERIRKKIDVQTNSNGVPLTCSVGIASWPNDGVIRDEIIQAADVALYYAKQTGRNRTCLASDVALSQVLRMDTKSENKMTIISTIYALAATVDAKDHHTYGHSQKVSTYATEMAKSLGYSETRIAIIRTAALLHDIGKIGISDRLLEKTGPLTNRDWELIRTHPTLGIDILKHVEDLKDCLPAVKYHHERYDGKGYPEGLKGENIPLDARILAVADSYDAMTSTRPYRKGNRTHEQALEEIKRCSGSQFDPAIVEVFARLEIQPKPKTAISNRRAAAIRD